MTTWKQLRKAVAMVEVTFEEHQADLAKELETIDYSGNDEWLPQYCEFADKVCPNTVGVACWEQYLEHMDRKAGGQNE